MVDVHSRYGDRVGFVAVAVAVAQSQRSVRRHLEDEPIEFPMLWDDGGRAVRAFLAPGRPTSWSWTRKAGSHTRGPEPDKTSRRRSGRHSTEPTSRVVPTPVTRLAKPRGPGHHGRALLLVGSLGAVFSALRTELFFSDYSFSDYSSATSATAAANSSYAIGSISRNRDVAHETRPSGSTTTTARLAGIPLPLKPTP